MSSCRVSRVFARVNVEVHDFAVGMVSWMIESHLLSKFAPLMISAMISLLIPVLREAVVRKGIISSLALLKVTGMADESCEARSFLAWW